eukprot:scaffold1564_cov174-Amphora_coffeaeformis.AAC.12
MHPSFVPYRVAGAYIAQRLEREGIDSPEVGIICGSGLSDLSNALEGKTLTVRILTIRNQLARLDVMNRFLTHPDGGSFRPLGRSSTRKSLAFHSKRPSSVTRASWLSVSFQVSRQSVFAVASMPMKGIP